MPTEPVSRELIMRYTGGMVKHLGMQMYSGAVGAVAELIANTWDADASEAYVSIPLGQLWDHNSEITVSDNGIGMTFDECNEHYLLIGRDRRRQGEYTAKNRKVIGRKGIGKLACFGIAKIMDVRTVKNNWLTHFRLDYDEIIQESDGEFVSKVGYKPEIISDKKTEEPNGTTIILKRIQLKRIVTEDEFRRSMARRFVILSNEFRVYISKKLLERTEMPFQFRYPDKGVSEEDIPGIGTIRWWTGFTETPIKEEEARGFVVMVRGKMAQSPFFFHISGGVYGQHGMQYLTGEIHADALDDNNEIDVIATDRASIRWEDPSAAPLLEWGAKKVKDLLTEWAEQRSKDKIEKLKLETPLMERINRYPERERKEILRAVQQFANIPTMTQERFEELVDLFLKAYENQQFMEIIRAINALDESQQANLFALLAEANVLEAVQMATIIRMKVEIIKKFREMIKAGVREKPEMHDILRENHWLIDPTWSTLAHEKSLEKVLDEHLASKPPRSRDGKRRVDFFCLGDSMRKIVVEVKRPGITVGKDEIQQTMDLAT